MFTCDCFIYTCVCVKPLNMKSTKCLPLAINKTKQNQAKLYTSTKPLVRWTFHSLLNKTFCNYLIPALSSNKSDKYKPTHANQW